MKVAHLVFRFDYGGLENGIVNLVRELGNSEIHHVVIALTEATDFAERLPQHVSVHSIGKRPGKDVKAYFRLFRLLRELRPDIVHTRNFGTMDCAVVAFLAGVPVRIHGEHGWDIFDPDGTSRKYRWLRKILQLFVHRVVAVSADIARWLTEDVGLPSRKVVHISNGVDTQKFRPPAESAQREPLVVGSVTRFSAIKDPLNLIEAFIAVRSRRPGSVRLMMIGDGELYSKAIARIRQADAEADADLPGSRDDIAEQLRTMDVFVLGSLREGISNTILEAMASGLPVIACDTGGNPELIVNGENGRLVPPGDSAALADAIAEYVDNRDRRSAHAQASRERALSCFSLQGMVENYRRMYSDATAMAGSRNVRH